MCANRPHSHPAASSSACLIKRYLMLASSIEPPPQCTAVLSIRIADTLLRPRLMHHSSCCCLHPVYRLPTDTALLLGAGRCVERPRHRPQVTRHSSTHRAGRHHFYSAMVSTPLRILTCLSCPAPRCLVVVTPTTSPPLPYPLWAAVVRPL